MRALFLAVFFLSNTVSADENIFTFGNGMDGSGACYDPEGCIALHVVDIPGGVRFVLESMMQKHETLVRLYGRVHPFMVPSSIVGLPDRQVTNISFTERGHHTPRSGDYDWMITFQVDDPAHRFDENGFLEWDFMGLSLAQLTAGGGDFFVAYVRGLNEDGAADGWFGSIVASYQPDPPHEHEHEHP